MWTRKRLSNWNSVGQRVHLILPPRLVFAFPLPVLLDSFAADTVSEGTSVSFATSSSSDFISGPISGLSSCSYSAVSNESSASNASVT